MHYGGCVIVLLCRAGRARQSDSLISSALDSGAVLSTDAPTFDVPAQTIKTERLQKRHSCTEVSKTYKSGRLRYLKGGHIIRLLASVQVCGVFLAWRNNALS